MFLMPSQYPQTRPAKKKTNEVINPRKKPSAISISQVVRWLGGSSGEVAVP